MFNIVLTWWRQWWCIVYLSFSRALSRASYLEPSIPCISLPPYTDKDFYYQFLHLLGGAMSLILCVTRALIASEGAAWHINGFFCHTGMLGSIWYFLEAFSWRQRGIGA